MSHSLALFHADMIANPKRARSAGTKQTSDGYFPIDHEIHALADDVIAYYKPSSLKHKELFLEHIRKAMHVALKDWSAGATTRQ